MALNNYDAIFSLPTDHTEQRIPCVLVRNLYLFIKDLRQHTHAIARLCPGVGFLNIRKSNRVFLRIRKMNSIQHHISPYKKTVRAKQSPKT